MERIGTLLRDARDGDAEARERLMAAYRNYLRLLARTWLARKLQGKVDASDVVQETLFKAHERFDQFRGGSEAELLGWLRQILARNVADVARRYARNLGRDVAREQSIEAEMERSSRDFANLLRSPGTSPTRAAERRELSVLLADALAEMDDDHREVIILRNLEDLDWPAIGRRMGRSPGAARMLWARALPRLRPLLEARL